MTSDAGYWDERTEQVKAAVRAAVTEESVLAYVAQRGVAVNAKQVTEALKPEGINGWTSTRRKRVDAVLAKLVKQGKLTRTVVREWDRQEGTSYLFGGAGVCQRHRAYFALPVEIEDPFAGLTGEAR